MLVFTLNHEKGFVIQICWYLCKGESYLRQLFESMEAENDPKCLIPAFQIAKSPAPTLLKTVVCLLSLSFGLWLAGLLLIWRYFLLTRNFQVSSFVTHLCRSSYLSCKSCHSFKPIVSMSRDVLMVIWGDKCITIGYCLLPS